MHSINYGCEFAGESSTLLCVWRLEKILKNLLNYIVITPVVSEQVRISLKKRWSVSLLCRNVGYIHNNLRGKQSEHFNVITRSVCVNKLFYYPPI